MAKHRQIAQHSLRARTVVGGVVASGVLLGGAPVALASAGPMQLQPPCNKECQHKLAFVTHVEQTPIGQHILGAIQGTPLGNHVQAAVTKWIFTDHSHHKKDSAPVDAAPTL